MAPWLAWLVFVGALGYAITVNVDVSHSAETWQWSETKGEVIDTKVTASTSTGPGGSKGSRSSSTSWELTLHYRYRVADREYQSERVGWDRILTFDTAAAARSAERAMKQDPLAVYYNPGDASQAVLVRGVGVGGYLFSTLFFGIASGLIVYSYSWRRTKRSGRRPGGPDWRSIRRAIWSGVGATLGFAVLQVIVFAIWLA